ncbi:hypothetical protein ACSBR2_004119 [Camellia fascicularis]
MRCQRRNNEGSNQAELTRQKNEETARRLAGGVSGMMDNRGAVKPSGPKYVQCAEDIHQWISYMQLNDGPIFRRHLVLVNGKMTCRYGSTIYEEHMAVLVKFSLALERKGSEP